MFSGYLLIFFLFCLVSVGSLVSGYESWKLKVYQEKPVQTEATLRLLWFVVWSTHDPSTSQEQEGQYYLTFWHTAQSHMRSRTEICACSKAANKHACSFHSCSLHSKILQHKMEGKAEPIHCFEQTYRPLPVYDTPDQQIPYNTSEHGIFCSSSAKILSEFGLLF